MLLNRLVVSDSKHAIWDDGVRVQIIMQAVRKARQKGASGALTFEERCTPIFKNNIPLCALV